MVFDRQVKSTPQQEKITATIARQLAANNREHAAKKKRDAVKNRKPSESIEETLTQDASGSGKGRTSHGDDKEVSSEEDED